MKKDGQELFETGPDMQKNAALISKIGMQAESTFPAFSRVVYYSFRISDDTIKQMKHSAFRAMLHSHATEARTQLLEDLDKVMGALALYGIDGKKPL